MDDFLTEIKWNEYSLKAKVIASIYGLEPSRVEASMRVGEVIDFLEVPYEEVDPVPLSKGLYKLHGRAIVVKRGERYFIEPAFLSENGFKVLTEPERALERLKEELGVPFLIVKEVPFHCCWVTVPILGCAKYYEVPGKVIGNRLTEAPILIDLPKEGCWDIDLEPGKCFYGFPGYVKSNSLNTLRKLIVPIRYKLWKYVPWPSEWGVQRKFFKSSKNSFRA